MTLSGIGIDIVDIDEFSRQIQNGGDKFLDKVFLKQELKERALVSLAGVFAAKEAVMKTGLVGTGDWLKLHCNKQKGGKPEIELLQGKKFQKVAGLEISISHTDRTAVAVAVLLTPDK